MLTIKYDHKGFFGNNTMIEDMRTNYTQDDLKKVMSFFHRRYDAVIELTSDQIQIHNVYYWDSYNDKDNDIVTVRAYKWGHDTSSYITYKATYKEVKKGVYKA